MYRLMLLFRMWPSFSSFLIVSRSLRHQILFEYLEERENALKVLLLWWWVPCFHIQLRVLFQASFSGDQFSSWRFCESFAMISDKSLTFDISWDWSKCISCSKTILVSSCSMIDWWVVWSLVEHDLTTLLPSFRDSRAFIRVLILKRTSSFIFEIRVSFCCFVSCSDVREPSWELRNATA